MQVVIRAIMLVLALTAAPAMAQQQEVKRSITKIAGDLYRFQNNFHFSVFLVTPDGVIATDPINADAAAWLKEKLKTRFDKSVRYLIYSHDHSDHISGGEVFADTATVIAHQNTKAAIVGEKRPTAVPNLTFSDDMTVTLGGKSVHLSYVGPGHSDNSIVMNFPDERVLFAVDFVSVNRLPFKTMNDTYLPGLIHALKKVEGMDFDILAPGHGAMGMKLDVAAHRTYVEDLYNGVYAALREGKSLDEIKTALTLEKYKTWGQYEAWRHMNIEGVHARIQLHRRAQ